MFNFSPKKPNSGSIACFSCSADYGMIYFIHGIRNATAILVTVTLRGAKAVQLMPTITSPWLLSWQNKVHGIHHPLRMRLPRFLKRSEFLWTQVVPLSIDPAPLLEIITVYWLGWTTIVVPYPSAFDFVMSRVNWMRRKMWIFYTLYLSLFKSAWRRRYLTISALWSISQRWHSLSRGKSMCFQTLVLYGYSVSLWECYERIQRSRSWILRVAVTITRFSARDSCGSLNGSSLLAATRTNFNNKF